jgi:hypothetical protein
VDNHRRCQCCSQLQMVSDAVGQPETNPVHDDFGQILDTDGTVLLAFTSGEPTNIHHWPVLIMLSLAMDYSCSFVWTTSMRRCFEHAPLSLDWRRNLT